MKIWKTYIDSENYFQMDLTDDAEKRIDLRTMDGMPILSDWKAAEIEIRDPKLKRPQGDITGFCSDYIFLSEKAKRILEPVVKDFVEFLPVISKTDHCYMMYTTKVSDVFDTENSQATFFDNEKKRMILCDRYAFRNTEQLKGVPIFRIPQERMTNAFVTKEFISAVRDNGLTGLRFELVWDSESPADTTQNTADGPHLKSADAGISDKPYADIHKNMTFDELREVLKLEIPEGQVYTERLGDKDIDKTVLRYRDEKSDKFWQCECLGKQLMVNYGKWGTNGRYDVKEFDTEDACRKQAEKLIKSKKKSGYTETDEFEETGHFYFDCESTGLSPVTSNPVFRKYCTAGFYYDCINEYAPFGNDTGNDTHYMMQEWLRSTPIARSGEYAYHFMHYKWGMPCIPPAASKSITDEELLELAKTDCDGMEGAEVMRLSDQVAIAAVLAKFKIKGSLERYEIYQLYRSLDRMERLCKLLSKEPSAELLHIIHTIRSDIYCYDIDRYSHRYFPIVSELDDFWMKKIRHNEELGRCVFNIPENIHGRELAEKVYDIAGELFNTNMLPEGFETPRELYFSLGCMFGQAICSHYGWSWIMCGEPDLIDTGFQTMTQFYGVVSPDKMFCILPSAVMRSVISGTNIGPDGENDNTVLLLFNMIETLDEQKKALNPDEIMYMPIG